MQIKIRKAVIDDISLIKELADITWPTTYKNLLSPDQVAYMMNLFYSHASLAEQFTKHTFIIAYQDDEAVGFASYSPTSTPGIYKLHKLYVNMAIQRRGLGRALITFIVDKIKAAGAIALQLNVKRDNPAKLFYEKRGFKVIREEDIDIGNGFWLQDFVMEQNL